MAIRGELHLTSNGSVKTYSLDVPRFTVGRDAENSLCLQDPVVSRYHAEFIRLGNDFLLRDLGSTNGSYVNGDRVNEQMLNNGDVVRFGKAGPELKFVELESSGPIVADLRHHPSTTVDGLISSLSNSLNQTAGDVVEEANRRCILAEKYITKGQHADALATLAKYTDPAALSSLPPSSRAQVLLLTGRTQSECKQYGAALDALQKSLDIASSDRDEAGIAAAHAAMGQAHVGLGDLLVARDHLHRAMLTARRAGNARLRAEAHLQIGRADWKEGDLEGARYNWTRAGRFAEGTNDEPLLARVALQQAFVLYSEGNVKEAVPAFQAAVDQLEAIGNVRLLLKAYSGLSRLLTRSGAWAATERLLEDRLRLARDNGLAKSEAVALTDLAELRQLQGNDMAAWNVITAALERHGQTVYARTQRILGRILIARGDRAEAIAALSKGLTAASLKGSLEEQILSGLELALAEADSGDTERAREHLVAAESITSLDPALNLLGRALYVRGRIALGENQLAEANRAFSQSLSLLQTVGDPFRTGQCHIAIGQLRTRMGRAGSARAHLEEAQQIFAKLGAAREVDRVTHLLESGAFDNVEAALTRTLSSTRLLSLTAPLSMANIPTMNLDSIVEDKPKPYRVLVAVANEELASLLKNGMEVENYEVDSVPDGRQAFEKAIDTGAGYDMLVLDALLEHRSGFDVCRELRKRQIEKPVMLLGGRQGVEDKIEALQAGADDFMSKKGIVFEELLAKMEALLR